MSATATVANVQPRPSHAVHGRDGTMDCNAMCQHSAASHQLISSFARLVDAFSRANAATAVIRPKHVLECIHGASTTVGQNNHSCRESTVRALVSATTHSVSGLAGILPTAEFVYTHVTAHTPTTLETEVFAQRTSSNADESVFKRR
jgi:hypothetical protein